MAENKLSTFPETETQALAMLYVQHQDLSAVTPESLLDMYQETYQRIKAYKREKRNKNQEPQVPPIPAIKL